MCAVVAGRASARRPGQSDDARQGKTPCTGSDGRIGDQIEEPFALAVGAPDDTGVTEGRTAAGAGRSTAVDSATADCSVDSAAADCATIPCCSIAADDAAHPD
jgi:hypothetical protein